MFPGLSLNPYAPEPTDGLARLHHVPAGAHHGVPDLLPPLAVLDRTSPPCVNRPGNEQTDRQTNTQRERETDKQTEEIRDVRE